MKSFADIRQMKRDVYKCHQHVPMNLPANHHSDGTSENVPLPQVISTTDSP